MESFLSKILNYLGVVLISLRETKTLKDKLTIMRYYIKAPLFLVNHLRGKKNIPILSSDVTVKNKYGVFFCGNNKYSFLGFTSLNEPNVKIEMLKVKNGVVLDIGANGGMNTVPVARGMGVNGKVIAIEPEPKNFSILKKNIKLNNLKNVVCINAACYKSEGTLKLHLDKEGPGGHSLLKDTPIEKNGFIEVRTRKVDNIVKETNIKNIKLIKIDVEGAEADVLVGAGETLKKYHPKIIFEAWSDKHFKEIKKVLNKYDYKYKKIGSQDYLAF